MKLHLLLFQTSEETTLQDMNTNSEELVDASSDILDSDLGENPPEETEDENDDINDDINL